MENTVYKKTYHFHFGFDEELLHKIDHQKESVPENYTFTDYYFDTKERTLIERNLWLKKRNFEWTLKQCSVDTDVIHGEEFHDEQQILQILGRSERKLMDVAEYKCFCILSTYRLVYRFSNFLINLDCVDLALNQYYFVGEVSYENPNQLPSFLSKLMLETNSSTMIHPVNTKIFQWLYLHEKAVYQRLRDISRDVDEYKSSEKNVNFLTDIKSIPFQRINSTTATTFETVIDFHIGQHNSHQQTATQQKAPKYAIGFVENVMRNIEERASTAMEKVTLSDKALEKAKELLTLLESAHIRLPSVLYPSINEDGTIDLTVKTANADWTISILEDHVDIFKLQDNNVQMSTNLIVTGENANQSAITEIKNIFSIA